MWGGAAAQADGTFGAFHHIGLAALVLVLIIFFNRSSNRYLRMSSIVIGLVVGYVLAWALGMVDFSAVQSYGGLIFPFPSDTVYRLIFQLLSGWLWSI